MSPNSLVWWAFVMHQSSQTQNTLPWTSDSILFRATQTNYSRTVLDYVFEQVKFKWVQVSENHYVKNKTMSLSFPEDPSKIRRTE